MATKTESAEIGVFKPKCGKLIYSPGAYYGAPCGKTAAYEEAGAYYCKRHHPPTVKAKKKARDAAWNAKYDLRAENIKSEADELAAMRKDAARYRKLRDGTKTRLRVWLPNEGDAGATGPFEFQSLDAALDAE